jgi:transcriptional regulator with AAA-type ATPase domain
MQEWIADRFVAVGGAWIDLASGAPVRVRRAAAGSMSSQLVWSDRCAELSRLRHPLINSLLDYGPADAARTFEAYSLAGPIRTSGTSASLLLTHAVRFIESRGLPLTSATAKLALRETSIGTRASGRRPLGILLQPRRAIDHVTELLGEASPGGTTTIDVVGAEGSGLRTSRVLAARAARLAGYVPISSAVVLRLPWIHACLWERHVCVLLDDRHSIDERHAVAAFLTGLGTASARRHVLLRFLRARERCSGTLELDALGVTAMNAMVFVDRDLGPRHEEIFAAAREAAGLPGIFLETLRAASFSDQVARIAAVHESSPAYEYDLRKSAARAATRGIGRTLRDAAERAARLADRGRHAAAERLLARASRVLEARGERAMAGACSEQLAWIERGRGRSDRALEQFERARTLGGDGLLGTRAVVGIGVVWTDERRFLDAEAALRAASSAAELLRDDELRRCAECALARCLFWQSRHDEAAVRLAAIVEAPVVEPGGVDAWALLARTRVASGDLRGAVAAVGQALDGATRLGRPRAMAVAARSMAVVQTALGDRAQVRHWVERGLRSAAEAHLPLASLRLRGQLLAALGSAGVPTEAPAVARLRGYVRAALARRSVPALLRGSIEAACVGTGACPSPAAINVEERALADLQQLLEVAHGAADDRAAVESLCQLLCDRLRAASVLVGSGPGEPRTLVRAGRPWQGGERLVDCVFASGAGRIDGDATAAGRSAEPRQAAEPIRYGQEPIAVLCCRWTPGVDVDRQRVSALLRAGALAAAAPVRGLLDRCQPIATPMICADLIGTCAAATALREAIARAARAPFPVLIEGESGSGKELVARGIHKLSARRDRRMCTLNCAALSDDLVEAELFGHVRGAFTGAIGERPGLFEEADGGTLFLDEVGELSPRAQAKLLRVLQDGEVRRVGENLPRRVDARIVAATNRRLDAEVESARFRADLRFRLDVVRIVVPPLRDRVSDIPALAMHFWADAAGRVGSSATLTAETLCALARHDWPGNVRELQNVVASLAVHAPRRGRIVPAMLPVHIARAASGIATSFEAARADFERRFVRTALAQAGGQRARAAQALGVSRQGLAKMIKRLKISE